MAKNYSNLSANKRRAKWRFYRNRQVKRNKHKGLCSCGNIPVLGLSSCQDCIERSNKWTFQLKQEVITAYGGKCSCLGCGLSIFEFLTVDHIKRGGGKHRRSLPKGQRKFYSWLKKHGYPKKDFQCLCMNCNWAGRYGTCPLKNKSHV